MKFFSSICYAKSLYLVYNFKSMNYNVYIQQISGIHFPGGGFQCFQKDSRVFTFWGNFSSPLK